MQQSPYDVTGQQGQAEIKVHKGRCPKKKRDFLGIFPKGGGVFSNPKTFVNLPSVFLYAKIILRCQNMFYNSGEVISDQFHHITLDSKSGKFWKKSAKTRSFGNFFHCEGGGSPIPKSICQNSYQKVNIFVKTKNAPNDLKCKINHTFFLETGVPKRGEWGGSDTWEKFPTNPVFFWAASLIKSVLIFFLMTPSSWCGQSIRL